MLQYSKIILAVLLLLCLTPMPYGYYQLVRLIAMVIFCVIAYQYFKKRNNELAIVFAALALLFQPFIKVALERTIWNIIDLAVAIALVVLWWKEKKK
ncbi:MAG: hypothetical protein K6C10_08015 [Prevotella sp.]|nr:hypothetical protein [Prevotella sp.]